MKQEFTGTLSPRCKINYIPRSPKDFIKLLLDGPKICTDGNDSKFSDATRTIAQIIIFNYVK